MASTSEYEQQQFWEEEKLQCIYWKNNTHWVGTGSLHDSIALLIKTINNGK